MGGLGDRPQRAALVEGDGEDRLGIGEHRVQVDAGDLGAVLVERDVADEMLGERRVYTAGADRDGDLEPLSALHLVRRLDLRRVLLVVRAADLPELRRELLGLTLGAHPGGAGDEDEGEGDHGEDGRRLCVAHATSPLDHRTVSSRGETGGSAPSGRADCTAWPGTPRRPRPSPCGRPRSGRKTSPPRAECWPCADRPGAGGSRRVPTAWAARRPWG